MSNCPICHYGQVADPLSDPLNTLLRYTCDKCGTYLITDLALERIKDDKKHTFTPKIAAHIRSRNISRKEPMAIFLDANRGSYTGSVNFKAPVQRLFYFNGPQQARSWLR